VSLKTKKCCGPCNEVRPLVDFSQYKSTSGRILRRHICRSCDCNRRRNRLLLNPEILKLERDRQNIRRRERYAKDEQYRLRIKEAVCRYQKKRYHNDLQYRSKRLKRRREISRSRYANDAPYRLRKINRDKKSLGDPVRRHKKRIAMREWKRKFKDRIRKARAIVAFNLIMEKANELAGKNPNS
jgi:hypothetical protein